MNEGIESWLNEVQKAFAGAEFVSLEPEDGEHALLAAYWKVGHGLFAITTFSNQAFGKPEFWCQIQASEEEAAAEWALAVLQFADDHRATTDLLPGALFTGKHPLVDGSTLDSWVVGLAVAIPGLASSCLHLYPVYAEEIDLLREVGLSKFLAKAGESIYDPARQPIKKELPG